MKEKGRGRGKHATKDSDAFRLLMPRRLFFFSVVSAVSNDPHISDLVLIVTSNVSLLYVFSAVPFVLFLPLLLPLSLTSLLFGGANTSLSHFRRVQPCVNGRGLHGTREAKGENARKKRRGGGRKKQETHTHSLSSVTHRWYYCCEGFTEKEKQARGTNDQKKETTHIYAPLPSPSPPSKTKQKKEKKCSRPAVQHVKRKKKRKRKKGGKEKRGPCSKYKTHHMKEKGVENRDGLVSCWYTCTHTHTHPYTHTRTYTHMLICMVKSNRFQLKGMPTTPTRRKRTVVFTAVTEEEENAMK